MEITNKRKKIYWAAAVLCALLFLACMVWLVWYLIGLNREQRKLEELRTEYVRESEAEEETGAAKEPEETPEAPKDAAENKPEESAETEALYPGLDGYDVPQKKIDLAALKENENEDIYAWITVPGTEIDYPVLQHPTEADYYLHHNLDGSKGYPGCIYSQLYNSKDWDDALTILYGHNMRNGTMFASLHRYEDVEFFEEHPYIYIYTEDVVKVYRIYAVYEYVNVNLVLNFRLTGQENYENFLDSIFELDGFHDHFDTDVKVTAEDRVLILETCVNKDPDSRFLVQSVQVAEGVMP